MSAPLHILIIDDHRDAGLGLQQLLELDGHRVALAYDGPSGLGELEDESFDLVLCDLGLPGMDGFEVAEAIRADRPDLPLFALTGYGDRETAERAEQVGFDGRLVKPVDLDRLQSVLASVESR